MRPSVKPPELGAKQEIPVPDPPGIVFIKDEQHAEQGGWFEPGGGFWYETFISLSRVQEFVKESNENICFYLNMKVLGRCVFSECPRGS